MPAHLGYYNHNQYPVSFASGNAQTGPVEIQAGQPVVDSAGKLIPHAPVLEQQVMQGLLRRIAPDDPAFVRWDRMAEQRANAIVGPNSDRPTVRRDNRQSPASVHPPEVNISSSRGVEHVDVEHKYGTLPTGTTVNPGGGFTYDNRHFVNETALRTYLRSQGLGAGGVQPGVATNPLGFERQEPVPVAAPAVMDIPPQPLHQDAIPNAAPAHAQAHQTIIPSQPAAPMAAHPMTPLEEAAAKLVLGDLGVGEDAPGRMGYGGSGS